MALLYQEVMNVPGLSGTWQQRNAQLYQKLGSPMGAYQGNLQQNLYLLDQIKKNNYFKGGLPGQQQAASTPAPTPAPAPTVSSGTQAGQEAKREDWDIIMPWAQYFDENLAKSSEAARAARYFDPLVQQGREGIEGQYASRGLTRSSMRGKDVMKLYSDMRGQEEKMRDQLYGVRESQAREGWRDDQSLYEDDKSGFKPSEYKMEPYEYKPPSESPYRYASSYRQWLNNMYK
jgi:hypothetical protein